MLYHNTPIVLQDGSGTTSGTGDSGTSGTSDGSTS